MTYNEKVEAILRGNASPSILEYFDAKEKGELIFRPANLCERGLCKAQYCACGSVYERKVTVA